MVKDGVQEKVLDATQKWNLWVTRKRLRRAGLDLRSTEGGGDRRVQGTQVPENNR